MKIDVHHHVVPPQFVAGTPMPVAVPDTDTQLQTMDSWDIAAAITSITPRILVANPTRLREVARACNEFQASLVHSHPSRFGSFAALPLPDVDGALQEVAYALDDLGLDGVGMFSNSNSQYLGDPAMKPLFEELNRRKAVVFVHPAHCAAPEGSNLNAPPSIVEYVFDTTRAIVNLLYTGTFTSCPNLRFIFSHAGGAVPFLTDRITSSLAAGPRINDALAQLQSLYYDTASAAGAFALRSLQALVDVSHILWGSDLPFIYGDRLREEIDHWQAYDGVDDAGRAAVECHNAMRLFPRLQAT